MKNVFAILSLLMTITLLGQNFRYSYDYSFISDSLDRGNIKTETMYLDVSKKGSKFYSRDAATADSIIAEADKRKVNINFNSIKFGLVSFIIEKSYSNNQLLCFNRLEMDYFKVLDDRKLDWKVLPEKEKIGELNAQKALVNFAGRDWIAWFTTEIPIQDGPYKFRGLPGLIIKIEDKTKSHLFVLNGIKNLGDKEWKSRSEESRFQNSINLPVEKYNKVVIDYRLDPAKSMRQKIVKMVDQNGVELDIKEVVKQREKAAKMANAKDNNFLELDILKAMNSK